MGPTSPLSTLMQQGGPLAKTSGYIFDFESLNLNNVWAFQGEVWRFLNGQESWPKGTMTLFKVEIIE